MIVVLGNNASLIDGAETQRFFLPASLFKLFLKEHPDETVLLIFLVFDQGPPILDVEIDRLVIPLKRLKSNCCIATSK